MTNTPSQLVDVSPDLLEQWLASGDTVLIDVRDDFEHATERIDGAELASLSTLDPTDLRARHGHSRVVFHCRTGRRSAEAARRFQIDAEPTYHLAGGIEGWKNSGRRTVRSAGAPKLDVMRQVQMTAGSLVLGGVVLGTLVSPWFLILSGFVGAGLVFAGASGWCGMAKLLARMPWNRVSAA